MNRPVRTAPTFAASPLLRRFVLGTAFFLGLAVALAPRSPAVHAQEPKSPPVAAPTVPAAPTPPAAPKSAPKSMSITDGHGAEIKIDMGDGSSSATPSAGQAGDAGNDTQKSARHRRHARVTIDGIGDNKDFDSFDEFVHDEPALAGMVVAVVALVFLAPVLAIALILWYRMRKARMLNETMLKLAEKGVVPSTDALDALAGGKQVAAAVAPYYEQAKQIQRKAAWSDLRKGVLMIGFGVALSMYSLLNDREPNGLGLVLLFVGLGFVVLWWFEQRHLPGSPVVQDAARGSGVPPASPPPPL